MLDTVIRGGSIIDGTGAPATTGDVGIRDGRIVGVGGRIDEPAREEIDADGCIVTPGWVDVHTHYDGQATWDDAFEPSTTNGVTTLVMGNCGVGFAPVRAHHVDALIDVMEGVEDIPGAALHVGMPWGEWETFPEYLDVLGRRSFALDIGAQLAHGALRFYVMGERGAANEDATAEDLAAMTALVTEALTAGALGITTSRTIGHRSVSGQPVPGTFAAAEELMALAEGMRAAGRGVFEAIVAGTIGSLEGLGGERATPIEEVPLLIDVSRASGRPVTFTAVQLFEDPTHWRRVLDATAEANASGADLHPQVIPRSVTIMTNLDAYHLFRGRPAYEKIASMPLADRVAEMRRPEVRAAILSEPLAATAAPDLSSNLTALFSMALAVTFPLREPVDYEPDPAASVAARAAAAGIDPEELMYDLLLEDEGRAFYAVLGSNFVDGTLEVCREMLADPHTVTGLSDAGAHVNLISDCSASTFHLTHWGRDRTRGEQLPLELLVAKLSGGNARLYGLDDRGVLAPGRRADLNVIDMDRLEISAPFLRHDLPAGASRILQPARGYQATMVAGTVTRRHDADTGARPGRLVRGPQPA
ncbi:MAG: N-acyl-D-amino-acid deacylase family protein [Iamia sp.]